MKELKTIGLTTLIFFGIVFSQLIQRNEGSSLAFWLVHIPIFVLLMRTAYLAITNNNLEHL